MDARRLALVGIVAVGVALAAAGVTYLAVQCQNIPTPLPGRDPGSTDHRYGFAAAALILAALVFAAGAVWRRPRPRPHSL